MSAENIKNFCKHLANNYEFRCQLNTAKNQNEWLSIVSNFGFVFTKQ
ncbi:Nif11-like leader peptide family natural product precursor [Desmonostoc muscorum]|uniref:Nif11-like leader peptide family natural product n=1 Tax=Desmonostoc muscorum LEGE 12446 TaxID=1828758 RepID=A0A8J7D1K3_DESMC|nr:Nif11-like leader peptide family natural product precursor [Desmonostoc muscorum]